MECRWDKVWPHWCPKVLNINKTISEYVNEWSKLRPDSIALSFYGRDITYRQLDSLINKLANAFVYLGTQPGDRIGLFMQNCPQFVIAYCAIQRAGGIAVPLNPMFKSLELEHETNDAGIKILLCLDSLYKEVKKIKSKKSLEAVILTSLQDFLPDEPSLQIPEEAKQEKMQYTETIELLDLINKFSDEPVNRVKDLHSTIALLQYTGGTTGMPKGAMITHYALSYAAIASMYWYRFRENDVFLGVPPFFHIMGEVVVMCCALVSGARNIILSRFSPEVAAEAITKYRCTFLLGPPTMMIALLGIPELREKYDLSSLRIVWTGGAPISTELQAQIKEVLPNVAIGEGYGLTEVTAQGGAITPLYRYKPGFVGIPNIGVEMKIMKDGKEVGINEEGEIVIRSPAMFIGYWNKPQETEEVLKEGWFYTGDIGLMDEEGYLKFLGRRKEVIKCSGYSVFPVEIENMLYMHPAIKEVAVIGVEDPYRGESPKAFIVLKEEYIGKISQEDIINWCKDNMASYKRPRFIEFRKDLPKSAAGKILKRVLVEEEKKKGEHSNGF